MSIINTIVFILKHPLNKGRKAEAILNYLRWQIGSRLVPGQVIFHWVNDAKFIVSPGETGLTQNIYCGLHEFEDMAYVLHVLNSGDLFIDIGANVGSYTILACAVRGARGYCFEPIPTTYMKLLENLTINQLASRVKAFNIGIADNESDLFFTSGENSRNHIITDGEARTDAIKVKVRTLDSILEGESPSLIKIDVEGFETLVINGALNVLSNPSLQSIIMELNGSGKRYGFDEYKIIQKIHSYGFQPYSYNPFKRKLTLDLEKKPRSGNTLFIRDEVFIKTRIANALPFKIGRDLI